MTPLSIALALGVVGLAATQADAGQLRFDGPAGYRHAPPMIRGHVQRNVRVHLPPRRYAPAPQYRLDPGAAIAGALAGAALMLIPRAAEALAAKLPPPRPAAAPAAPPPAGNPLAEIEPNPRGITRAEVEAALVDWCATHADAPLCIKLRAE